MNDFKGKKIAITRPIERSQEAIKIIEDYGGTVLVALHWNWSSPTPSH